MSQQNSREVFSLSSDPMQFFQNQQIPPKIPPSTPVKEKHWLQWAKQVFAFKNARFWNRFPRGSRATAADGISDGNGAGAAAGGGIGAQSEQKLKAAASGEESRVRRLAFGYEAPPDEHKGCTLIIYSLTSNILGVMLLTFAIGVIIVLTLIFMAKWSDGTWRKW